MENRIIEKASHLFFRFGIRGVSMDDISRELGISKKTLYIHFENKNAIVEELIRELIEQQKGKMKEAKLKAGNAVEEIMISMNSVYELLMKVNNVFFLELKRYFPEIWQKVEYFKCEESRQQIMKNMERGIKEKLFRKDIDKELLATIRQQQLDSIFNENNQDLQLHKLLLTYSALYLFGISTPEGYKVVEENIRIYYKATIQSN